MTSSSARAPTSTTRPSTATTSVCSSASAIAAWPVSRRAAQLVVVPALNGQITPLAPLVTDGVGGVLLLGGLPPVDLAAQVGAADRVGAVAPFVMADEEGGGVQRLANLVANLPWARQMAATMSTAQVQAAALQAARQMRAAGVGMDLAPVLDVDGGAGPNSRNADGQRSFSADPATAARYGTAFLAGLRAGGVVPVVKHFPGLGGATANTDYGPANTPALSTLRSRGLVPFVDAFEAGAPAVMVANATVPGLTSGPASLSAAAMETLLRGQLGFGGLVLTDSLSGGAITAAGYDVPHAAAVAIAGGADLVLFGSTLTPADTALLSPANVAATATGIIAQIVDAVGTGALPVNRLDDAVGDVLRAKGVPPCAG